MSEIPEDVLNAAKRAAYACEATGDGEAALTSFIGVRAVCAAILAERKRCAEVARNYGTAPGLPDGKSGAFRKHRHAIAEAIESAQ